MCELAWKKIRTREGEWVGLNDDEKRRRRTDSSRGNVLVPLRSTVYNRVVTYKYIQVHKSTSSSRTCQYISVRTVTYST